MMLQWLVILLTPIVAMLAVLVVPIMATLATPAFLPVAPVALVVAVSFAMFHIGIVGERVLVLAHRPRSVTLIYVGMAVVNAVLNVMLVPRLGLIGAAVATLASFGLYSTVTLVKARNHCQFHLPLSTLVRSAFAAAVGAAVASQLAGEGVPRIVFAAVAGGLVYTAMLVAVGGVPLSTLRTWMRPISDAG
jgi:O-antigen/teichoic acid export membrane protein